MIRFVKLAILYFKNRLELIIAFFLGISWHIYVTLTGISISPDSGYFLSSALRFYYGGDYFLFPVRPPLYPFLLYLSMFLKPTPAEAAAWLSGIVMILVLMVFAMILRRFSNDTFLNVLFLLMVFTFNKILYVFIYAWTESVFCLFTLLAVYFLIRHYESRETKFYIFAALSVSLAALTRYMGYSLVVALFFYTLYFLWNHRTYKDILKWKYLALHAISYVPSLIYITRNYFVNGTFHGMRRPSTDSLFENFTRTVRVLEIDLSFYFTTLLIIAIVVFILLMRNVIFKKNEKNHKYVLVMGFIFGYLVIYLVLMIYTCTVVGVDQIATRYFSPLYPIIFLFVFIAIWNVFEFLGDGAEHNEMSLMRNIVKILLYCFLLTSVLIQFRGMGKFMETYWKNEIIKKGTALVSGYNRSSVPGELTHYFSELFKSEDAFYIGSVYETPLKVNNPYLGCSLFLNGKTFRQEELGRYTYDHLQPETKSTFFSGFSIVFDSKFGEKQLNVVNLPRLKVGKRLMVRIAEIMTKKKVRSFILVINNDRKDLKIGANLVRYLPKYLSIIDSQKIGGYVIYRVRVKNERNITSK